MNFVPLHNHSEFSALDGLSTPKEIAARAVELGCPCCGLTDHGTVAGHLLFAKELAAVGIKPIFGCELYHGVKTSGWARNERDQAHFVAGALTDEGLRNLWRLVDAASKNFRYVGRVNWDMLEKHSEGLFATSACVQGLVPRGVMQSDLSDLNRYIELFGDNFYIELHTYPTSDQEDVNQALVSVAQERGIPVVYANDAHFAFPNQYATHDAYVAMQTGQGVDTPLHERKMWHPLALYMQDESEIRDALHYLPTHVVDEALANTVLIGERANANLPEAKRHLPTFIPRDCPYVEDKSISSTTLFIDLVEEGLNKRYTEPSDAIWLRANREMEVFLAAGLHDYFLQTWDFCQFCDRNGITRGPGRGSAAGSIVAYALGITDVDPIRFGLVFERFYNPGREKGLPDIDNDFPQGERKRVKEYLASRWGEKRVRAIGTVTRLKPKAALDKTYKALGVTWQEKEELKAIVASTPDLEILDINNVGWRNDGGGKEVYILDKVGRDIEKWVLKQPQQREPVIRRWMDMIDMVCGRVSGYGVHASGVVVSDVDLDENLPAMWSANQETQATMFAMKDVERLLYVKQDILGLRTLDTLQEWARLIRSNYNVDVKWSGLELKDHPEEMWELLDKGLATGIFQIEDKQYVRQLAMNLKPRSVEDLSLIAALNRPGPIRSGAPESIIIRRAGGTDDKFDGRTVPLLSDTLNETYGWFIYQEQVIEFFSRIGYSIEDADAVRGILGKKKVIDMGKLFRGEGEWTGKSYPDIAYPILGEQLATEIWQLLEDFAKYSFNKSHSLCYGVLALRTLYAKFTAPAEFTIACIRTNADEAGLYVAEGRRLGVKVKAPDIHRSDADVEVHGDEIYFGFSNIKGIGRPTGKYLKELTQKYDINDRYDLENALERESEEWSVKQKALGAANFKVPSPRRRCRSNVIDLLEDIGAFDEADTERITSLAKRQETEKKLLGVILTDDSEQVMEGNSDVIEESCITYKEFYDDSDIVQARLPGIISSIRVTKTKKEAKEMGFVKIEFGQDTIEFAVFPQQWKAYKFLWRERTPGIFQIKRSDRGINFEEGMKLG
jgi:DNA polymerase-3 subunit alpha